MAWLNTLFIVIQVLSAVAIIVLVLIQHGKGADMGAAFGSGASGSLFGASGAANFLSRSTAVMAAVFFAATLVLAYTSTNLRAGRAAGGGLISNEGDKGVPAGAPAGAPPTGAAPKSGAEVPATGAAPAGTPPADSKPAAPGSNDVPK
jgi:preprotein translocase subunit SecG